MMEYLMSLLEDTSSVCWCTRTLECLNSFHEKLADLDNNLDFFFEKGIKS